MLSKDHWMIAKQVDIQPIADDLKTNVLRLSELDKLVSRLNITKHFIDFRMQVEYIQKLTLDKISQVAPTIRIKRGLVNPLGSFVKIITGNLDNNDAVRYDNIITSLQASQKKMNNKVTLITEMTQKLANSTILLSKNLMQINMDITQLKREISQDIRLEYIEQIENQIVSSYNLLIHNFQSIRIKLDEIENSLALSRLGILHQSIIETDKFLTLLKHINKNEKLMYFPTLDNLVKIEQTIVIKVYLKGNLINYLLEVPLVGKDTYIFYKLIPLPVLTSDKTVVILPKYPYILVKGLTIMSLTSPCQEIDESSYLCQNDQLSPYNRDTCITELMTYAEKVTSCTQIPIFIGSIKVDPIQRNRWILYSRDSTIITRTCNNEVFRQNIRGTYVLTLDDPCEIKFGNISLKMHATITDKSAYTKIPIVNLPTLRKPEKEISQKPVNLEDVDLTDIKLLSYMLKKNEASDSESEKVIISVKSVSVWTIVLYIIMLVFLGILVYKHLPKLCKLRARISPSPKENFELKEGGVMSVQNRELLVSAPSRADAIF